MKTRTIVAIVAVGFAAVAAIGLSRLSWPVGGAQHGVPDSRASQAPALASAQPPPSSNSTGHAATEPRTTDAAPPEHSPPNPRYAEPEEIETQLGQFFATQSGLEVVSLSSIDCSATGCEIALAGTDVNPRYVDAYHDVYEKLISGPWSDFLIRSGSIGTREIAPGAREYVISVEYQPFVDLSADPLIAARQYAACAAFWRRQTEYPTPPDVVRDYFDRAERYVGLAASVLGEQEAARVAAETRGGPLLRNCF